MAADACGVDCDWVMGKPACEKRANGRTGPKNLEPAEAYPYAIAMF